MGLAQMMPLDFMSTFSAALSIYAVCCGVVCVIRASRYGLTKHTVVEAAVAGVLGAASFLYFAITRSVAGDFGISMVLLSPVVFAIVAIIIGTRKTARRG